MSLKIPLELCTTFLNLVSLRMLVKYPHRIPSSDSVLVVSNHRSFMDVAVLMSALKQPIRFACHHYMGQVPLMREIILGLGCFPIPHPKNQFLEIAGQFLEQGEMVGVFPEGATPMIHPTKPDKISVFQRGFAHLAFRANVSSIAVLPVAIASHDEVMTDLIPLEILSWFDPSEPLFKGGTWHPLIAYRHVTVLIGEPYWIRDQERQKYQGKQAKVIVNELANYCQTEITNLLNQGCRSNF